MNRFKPVSSEKVAAGNYTYDHHIVKDTVTGVLYYYISGGGGASALTPLIDADGKPLVDKVK